jgi:exodeoxyribonuclease VII small subunit
LRRRWRSWSGSCGLWKGAVLPLEEALALYERGQALAERCQRLLQEAQLRVRILERDESGALRLSPFEEG